MTRDVGESPALARSMQGQLMLDAEEVAAMKRLHELGWGAKRLSREFGCARNTVKRYLRESGPVVFRKPERRTAFDGLEDWLRELLLYPFGRSNFVLPTLVTMLSESILRRLPIGFDALLSRLDRLRAELDAQLGTTGVIIHPPYSRPAPRHKLALLTPFDASLPAPLLERRI